VLDVDRHHQFIQLGLPPTFLSDFQALVDGLQRAVDVRLSSKTVRGLAQAGIADTLRQGLDVIRDLDAIVAVATRQDPVRFAAWRSARRIEGLTSSSGPEKTPAPVAGESPDVAAPVIALPVGEGPTVTVTEAPLRKAS
jgi:hypothetical protein